jgi:hypothetical protein
MIQSLIKFILARLAGITPRQWATALQWVTMASKDFMLKTGENRKAAVTKMLNDHWPEMRGFALNLLIETAVAYQRSQAK